MLHQPDATDDTTLIPSERPGTANRMGIRGHKDNEGKELGETKLSAQNQIQLNQALPFASACRARRISCCISTRRWRRAAGRG